MVEETALYDINKRAFIDDLSYVFTDRVGIGGFFGPNNDKYIRDFRQIGFRDIYTDNSGPMSPQVRHFVGFLAAGFIGENIGGNIALQVNEGYFNPFTTIDADVLLGWKAIELGIKIKWGSIGLDEVADWIRDNIAENGKGC